MNTKLQTLINNLSHDEQTRLLKHLEPCIEARQELLALYQTQAAEGMTEKELLAKRSKFVGKKDNASRTKLAELDKQIESIRKKISDHIPQRRAAKSKFDVAKTRFEAHY